MSIAFALILLAEAATSCAPAGEVRLPGGATLVRPVGTDAPLPVERLGPAQAIEKPDAIRQTGARANPKAPDQAPPAEACEADAIEMV
jgi:hypothetical protein